MVFTAPAVHYSALATVPPEVTASKSQQSIKHTASVRFKLSRIFKRLLSNDIHNEHTITTEIERRMELPKTAFRLAESTEKEKNDDTSIIIKGPNNNNSGNRTLVEQESPRPIPPLERLPFTEPYFSIPSKNEKFPFDISAYHKHCIHQQKYIDQKQSSSIKQTAISRPNSSLSSSIKEQRSDLATYRLQNLIEQQRQIKFNNKESNSITTLPISSSIEGHIGLRHVSRRNTITNSYGIRSSYPPQQTQHLRRLHSKSKVRTISSETKTTSAPSSSSTPSISSSIAHRIEQLKQAMRNDHIEFHDQKSEKSSTVPLLSHSINDTINKQTQTGTNQLKLSEIHHIHHHHIHSSSILSLEWRTYISIVGTLSIIFLLLIELITIVF